MLFTIHVKIYQNMVLIKRNEYLMITDKIINIQWIIFKKYNIYSILSEINSAPLLGLRCYYVTCYF